MQKNSTRKFYTVLNFEKDFKFLGSTFLAMENKSTLKELTWHHHENFRFMIFNYCKQINRENFYTVLFHKINSLFAILQVPVFTKKGLGILCTYIAMLMEYLLIQPRLMLNEIGIHLLHWHHVINLNTIKFVKFVVCTFFKENMLKVNVRTPSWQSLFWIEAYFIKWW